MFRKLRSANALQNLKKEAKGWLKDLRAGNPDARARLVRAYPAAPSDPALRDVQHALAQEYGHENWAALLEAVAKLSEERRAPVARARTAQDYGRLADDVVLAFNSRDEAALARVNEQYARAFTFEDLWAEIWRRVYSFRQRAFNGSPQSLQLTEAQIVIAQDAGFGSWAALTRAVTSGAPPVPPYAIDTVENRISPRRRLSDKEWDELIDVMKERRLTTLDAGGLMTDAVLARLSSLDHVTALSLGGSRELSDDGLRHLARMPQLERLDLSEYPGGRWTDRGLAMLQHLPNLRVSEMTWQRGISDKGISHLRSCDRLEKVILMGSPTGDGAIEALQGKANLREFSSGVLVTDAGLQLLHNFPRLKTWSGGEITDDPKSAEGVGKLLIDGPFTDAGLAGLAGLEGVFDLDLFWHVTMITPEGFAHLRQLPNLMSLGADGRLSDNVAMRHYAAIPRLRRLRAQGAVANDDGFEALSRSQTLESFWGRECPHLGSRGFVALSRLPKLRGLGVSCKHVNDAALSTLPNFPALRELTPIDVQDAGFRHVGRCERLERLTCMYCRNTTDLATEQITNLPLKYYYAGLTQITDRSLELLGKIQTLEQVEFYECKGITDAGLPFLATLPRLREVQIEESPGVTLEGTRVFPTHVRVRYTT